MSSSTAHQITPSQSVINRLHYEATTLALPISSGQQWKSSVASSGLQTQQNEEP